MSWKEVAFEVPADQVEAGSQLLETLGALAVSLYDAEDQPIFEPPPSDEMHLWDKTVLVGLLDKDHDLKSLEKALKQQFPNTHIKHKTLEEQNWVALCQSNFPAKQFGKLWVCPSWSDKPTDPNAAVVELDPGMAFGTGTHPTTFLCLEWIGQQDWTGKTLVDYGCGSGILGLGALALGADKVFAVDHDPQALLSTEENRQRNHLEASQLSTHLPGDAALDSLQVDGLFANILSGPLLELKDEFIRLLAPSGELVLSGLLASQKEALLEHYQDEFEFHHVSEREDWICLSAKKR